MDVTMRPPDRTFTAFVTFSDAELEELKGSLEIIPDTAVVAKDLIDKICSTAADAQ